ncbi:Uncharacterized protein Rs2_05100 [Raphanus sativus]|nr:Uncharacterized protein Rs2_05100 [Raphanus sativus]
MQLPGGRSTIVKVEYERVRKKCFHCFRLSHEKQRCPLFKAMKQNCTDKGKGVALAPVIHRQNHPDLVGSIMPLLAPTAPPGFPSKSLVAPEVFEEMQFYMNCTDPEERRLREAKMVKALRDISTNPGAQSSYLHLENHPTISGVQNKNVGRVFDFRATQTEEAKQSQQAQTEEEPRVAEALIPKDGLTLTGRQLESLSLAMTAHIEPQTKPHGAAEGSGDNMLINVGVAFSIGRDDQSISGGSGKNRASKRTGASWKRFKPASQGVRKSSKSEQNAPVQDEGDSSVKRKAREGMESWFERVGTMFKGDLLVLYQNALHLAES